jgi:Ran-binding protein 3
MRADGVLRVILNASLYVGMQCLEEGKHIRMSVFEGKDLRHLTIRVSWSWADELDPHGDGGAWSNDKVAPSPLDQLVP